jgi:hypothetical protein
MAQAYRIFDEAEDQLRSIKSHLLSEC